MMGTVATKVVDSWTRRHAAAPRFIGVAREPVSSRAYPRGISGRRLARGSPARDPSRSTAGDDTKAVLAEHEPSVATQPTQPLLEASAAASCRITVPRGA